MTMPPLNLIPAHRVEARRRRVVRARCAAGVAAYAAAATVAGAAPYLLVGGAEGTELPAQLTAAAAAADRASGELSRAGAELGAVEAVLRSSRAIAEQPDWSALLALLAAKAGDDVFLKECRVQPREPPPPAAARPAGAAAAAKPTPAKPAGPPPPAVVVGLAGLGASQASVSQFALRLEATRLFDRVTLLDSSRQQAAGLDLVGFRIECTMADPGRGAPGGRPTGGGGR
jgi:hypothetical protein